MKNLIGKKVRGFKFESREGCDYSIKMDSCIGEIGSIKNFIHNFPDINICIVAFDSGTWAYPAELIEQHLVDHELTEKIEQYTDAIKEAIIKAYFNGTSLPQIKESIRQAYTAIEAGVNAQLVEIKEERGKI